jgi:hypothetical protein
MPLRCNQMTIVGPAPLCELPHVRDPIYGMPAMRPCRDQAFRRLGLSELLSDDVAGSVAISFVSRADLFSRR